MSSCSRLVVRGLNARWGPTPVLRSIDLDVADGEFLVLMGPNGSGKTTLLRCLAGLEPIDGGTIELDGSRIDRWPTHRRGIGMLFQDPAMFPGRTVWENVAYGPQIAGEPDPEVGRRVDTLLDRLRLRGLDDRAGDRLSGGERQRVALARTLAARPKLLLLDEPFAAVDMEVKAELRSEFREVLRGMGVSAIHVTHDREEALFLADRVAVLVGGAIVQVGAPRDVHDHPVSATVARFLGYNLRRTSGGLEAVHPDDVRTENGGSGGTVIAVGPGGRSTVVHLRLDSGERWTMRLPWDVEPPAVNARIEVGWDRAVRFPPPNGGEETVATGNRAGK